MRPALVLTAVLTFCGPAMAQDAKPPETSGLEKQVADLTARIDDLKRDVEELKRLAPITIFVPGATTLGAVGADAACGKAKYQGAIALRPATGGTTVLCVSIADPNEKPLH